MMKKTRVAFIGTGYVSAFYARTIGNHDHLELVGAFDIDEKRKAAFSKCYGIPVYDSIDELLADESVDIVTNFTVPRNHAEVSRQALLAGKHVYTEKPLAWNLEEGEELKELAASRGLYLASAPCTGLGEAAQTVGRAVRDAAIGKIRLVYAEMDDGPVWRENFTTWDNEFGIPWPHVDEFETGCVLEHAGYIVNMLVMMFGNATHVTSFARELVPEKFDKYKLNRHAPDFSVGCVEFENGVVARVTTGIVARKNQRLDIFGDEGSITLDDVWDYASHIDYHNDRFGRTTPLPLVRRFNSKTYGYNRMDFTRGIADLGHAIQSGVAPRLSADFALHVDAICHALANTNPESPRTEIKYRCESVRPMDWA